MAEGVDEFLAKELKKDISRLRSEVRKSSSLKVGSISPHTGTYVEKLTNPFTGMVSGNYWTQTGMPWVTSEGRKAVLTEWFWQPIRGQPRRVDTNELRSFSQTFWVNACVKTFIDELSGLEWDIIPKEDFEYEEVEDDIKEAKKFLTYPNKNGESFNILIRAVVKDVLELDAGVIVKVFSIDSYDFEHLEPKSGAPILKPFGQRKMVELYARDGSSFLKETDKFGFVRGYWQYSYQIPAHPMWFNRDEICYIMEQPRSQSTYGYARTQAILDLVKSLQYSTLYNKKFFEEVPLPEGVLSVLDTSEPEMKTLMDWWNREFKAQPHKLGLINKDIKWQSFTIPNKELEFLETQKQYFQFVIAMFGLTPSELGMTEDINRATATTQAELTKRKGIRPMMGLIERYINGEIMPELNLKGIEFTFIYDDPQEKSARLDNYEKEIMMGIRSPAEVRAEMGLPPMEDNENIYSGNIPVSIGLNTPKRTGDVGNPNRISPAGQNPEAKTKEENKLNNREGAETGDEDTKRRGKSLKFMKEDISHMFPAIQSASNELKIPVEQVRNGFIHEMEHADSVNGDLNIILQIAMDHLREDKDYYIKLEQMEYKPLTEISTDTVHTSVGQNSIIQKGIYDGQYYHVPQEVIRPNRGKIIQPQANQLLDPISGEESYIGNENIGEYMPIDKPVDDRSQGMKCPNCGYNAVSETTTADDVGRDAEFRCANCASLFTQDEMETDVIDSMQRTMESNNNTKPVSIPRWSPKNANNKRKAR